MLILIMFLIIILQCTVFKEIKVFKVNPNLIMVCIISASIFMDIEKAAIAGCITGFLYDMMFGKLLGIYALVFLFISLGASYYKKSFTNQNVLFNSLYVYMFSMAGIFFMGIFSLLINGTGIGIWMFTKNILTESLLNSLISVLIIPLMKILINKLELNQQFSEG
jgi:rod shape-determining protein MreD